MNKLLFTLSLVVLVAAQKSSDDIFMQQLKDEEQMRIQELAIIQRKCIKKSGNYLTFNKTMAAIDESANCLYNFIDATQKELINELKSPTKENMKIIFQKFCPKRIVLYSCIDISSNALELCLDDKDIRETILLRKGLERIIEFVCLNDGEEFIDVFVNDDNKQCALKNKNNIRKCISNATSLNYFNDDIIYDGITECLNMYNLKKCTLELFEECVNKEPANFVEKLFKIYLEETKCYKNDVKTTYNISIIMLFGLILFTFVLL